MNIFHPHKFWTPKPAPIIPPPTVNVSVTAVVSDYIADACLNEIANSVGDDWRPLATQLRISGVADEKLSKTSRAAGTDMVAALRAWRDRHLDEPSDAVTRLRRAFSTLGRTDLLNIVEFYARDARRSGSDRDGPKLVSTV